MDPKLLSKISRKVYAQFPELNGRRPKVAQSKAISSQSDNFVLTYSGVSKGIGGRQIPRHVRVVVNGSGKILKMSTSR
ncbi:hypothetical protein KQH54_01340 [bacterium]|nr:hypothetical protein [bacterium]